MSAYYNENDPFAAAWLRDLIARDLIAPGEVDERSVCDVQPSDVKGYDQCHFFAGIGGWSLALRLAGWEDNRPAWTGSCPCQPFSQTGEMRGESDERHLWPQFRFLISERKPSIIFGEQVSSPLARVWLARVRIDLEALGFAVGAADLPSGCVGSPQGRPRLYWMGYADSKQPHRRGNKGRRRNESTNASFLDPSSVGNAYGARPQGRLVRRDGRDEWASGTPSLGAWEGYDVAECADGKQRRIEPGAQPLADGISARVGRIRGYGNAINPILASEFIAASREAIYSEIQKAKSMKPDRFKL